MGKAKNLVYLLLGEDEYLLRKNTEKILKDYTEKVTISVADSDESLIRNELCSFGFFSQSKCVVLGDLENIDVKKGEVVVGFLDNVPEKMGVVFRARTLQRNRRWVKDLEKKATLIDCTPPKPYQWSKIVDKEISKFRLSSAESIYLKEALPKDLAGLYMELEKISLYPSRLDLSVLKSLVEPVLEDQVFTLVDYLIKRDLGSSVTALKELIAAGNEPFAILGAIIWQARSIYKVTDYRGGNPLRELGLRDYPYKKAKEAARRLPKDHVENWLLLALEADMNVKEGLFRPDVALEVLVTKICLGLEPAENSHI